MNSNTFKLLVLPGDHVGPEVINEALRVLDVIEELRPNLKFERTFELVGGSSIDKHGVPVTQEVLEKATQSDAVLFGSVGGPEWANASPNPESGLLQLRHKLDAFANLRPCELIVPSLLDASPLKSDIIRGTKFIVVRENCGGAYFGDKVETTRRRLRSLGVQTTRGRKMCSRVCCRCASIGQVWRWKGRRWPSCRLECRQGQRFSKRQALEESD
ncbi:3-isopropylmalate dehydrogenase [Metarhizium acridum]|nr:3-isopropylmalate dehydrogenase [Metarhizium acridum]